MHLRLIADQLANSTSRVYQSSSRELEPRDKLETWGSRLSSLLAVVLLAVNSFRASINDAAIAKDEGHVSVMSDFRKLLVWEKAHRLSLDVHAIASAIRGSNHSTLKSQLIRAAESIAQTIVEGCGEQTPSEFARYLRTSLNSANEVEYHLLVARDRDVLRTKEFEDLTGRTIEVRKMLYGLLRKVEGRNGDNGTKSS